MIEEQLADRFRAALADEPPLGFDPDGVIDRAGRTDRRRAMVFGASTAAAAVLLGAVAVLQVVRSDSGPAGGGVVPPTSNPCETKPTDPLPSETKPTEPGPSGTKPTEPGPPPTKLPESGTVTEPGTPCETKPSPSRPFTGWEAAVEKLRQVAPQVLAQHAPGLHFTDLGWKPYDDRRCVTALYQVVEAKNRAVGVTVCHERKVGLDRSAAAGGDWGQPVSETTNPDGSLLRAYRFDNAATGAHGLAVLHARPDGVVVQVDTGLKTEGNSGPQPSEQQLTAVATDARLSF